MEPGELTKFRNLEVEYFELTQKVPVVAKEISEMLAKAHSERDSLIAECDAKLAVLNKEEADMKEKHTTFKADEVESKEAKKVIDLELVKRKKELKQILKELTRTNSYVLAAQEELSKLSIEVSNANEQLKSLLILVEKVETTKIQLLELTAAKNRMVLEIMEEQFNADVKLRKAAEDLNKAQEELVTVTEQSQTAKTLWENYSRELHANMTDYAVVKARLEAKWKTTFPELEIPMN